MTRAARAPLAVALATAVWGIIAALHYHQLGLTLAHYDARAHLVVARRIFDSLTPGWQQVGAVWLPLPHLLDALPVQIDWIYRTGISGVAISIASMALAAWAIASTIRWTTGSILGGVVAAALLMLNPDVLYLQSTPMSEPLLFGTTFVAIALTVRWVDRICEERGAESEGRRRLSMAPGWALIAAALTRYEAWPIIAALLVLVFVVLLRRGWTALAAFRAVRGLALYPMWAVLAFLVNSKISVGAWFVDSGFFVPDNPALGHPWFAWTQVWDGLVRLTGPIVAWAACVAVAIVVWRAIRARASAPAILVLALAAAAILPLGAYFKGHPVRLRYDVPLVAAGSAVIGMGIALLPSRLRAALAVALVAVAVWSAHPFDRTAAVVVESQREQPETIGRRAVTAYLEQHWDGSPILMSMGSLGHYMHDLSYAGFGIHDFVHEGNGEIWIAALAHPQPYVKWIVVEEYARGGDVLYWQGKRDPNFFADYSRVAQGGNVALYRRMPTD